MHSQNLPENGADGNPDEGDNTSSKTKLKNTIASNDDSVADSKFARDSLHLQTNHAGLIYPNFDPNKTPLDPDRPLHDVPQPSPRLEESLMHVFSNSSVDDAITNKRVSIYDEHAGKQPSISSNLETHLTNSKICKVNPHQASMWELIASPELASHIELLQLGGLIKLPSSFFKPVNEPASNSFTGEQCYDFNDNFKNSTDGQNHGHVKPSQALLSPLTQLRLLDLSDIHNICRKYPNLTRYGFLTTNQAVIKKPSLSKSARGDLNNDEHNVNQQKAFTNFERIKPEFPELINDIFAPSWEVILYPERFDNGVDSLGTDILACSVAVHVLKQCQPRKSINKSLSVQQICEHIRSYVLSQCNISPQFEQQYRQIRLFSGHIIVAADYLGCKISQNKRQCINGNKVKVNPANIIDKVADHQNIKNKSHELNRNKQQIHLNISSRSSLFVRYPNICSYYINGWS